MTANVTFTNGKAEMAYVGDTPWWGGGNRLTVGAPIEKWIPEAGMDWRIRRSLVRYISDAQGTTHTMDDQHVLFRSDTKAPLGLVSPKYKTVQPRDVLEFFRDLVEGNGYTLETAGTLFGGKRFWATAAVGEEAVIVGSDQLKPYLMLATSCDGSLATTARFVTVRPVCSNTLNMALAGKAHEVVVKHTSHFVAEEVKEKLGLARGAFREFILATRQLAAAKVATTTAETFVANLLKDQKLVFKEDVTKTRQFMTIMNLFESGVGADLAAANGTAWGLVNAVTEFVDHHARAQSIENRAVSAMWGRGDVLKTEAMQRALALAA